MLRCPDIENNKLTLIERIVLQSLEIPRMWVSSRWYSKKAACVCMVLAKKPRPMAGRKKGQRKGTQRWREKRTRQEGLEFYGGGYI